MKIVNNAINLFSALIKVLNKCQLGDIVRGKVDGLDAPGKFCTKYTFLNALVFFDMGLLDLEVFRGSKRSIICSGG